MSELTLCNYCRLQSIKRRAKEAKQKVTVVYNSKWHNGAGCNIYVHPKEIDLQSVVEDSAIHDKYSVSWFMELPQHCCC